MSSLSDFDLDFRYGVEGEQAVANLLSIETVEVKTDRKWKHTGNLYVETYYWSVAKSEWVPSGINITKATHWAFNLEGTMFLVETPLLAAACTAVGKPIRCEMEPNPSYGVLIRPDEIIEYVRKVKSEHTV